MAITDEALIILSRKRGRPRRDEPGERLSTWLPVGDYDRLVQRAKTEEKHLSALVRDILQRDLRRP